MISILYESKPEILQCADDFVKQFCSIFLVSYGFSFMFSDFYIVRSFSSCNVL